MPQDVLRIGNRKLLQLHNARSLNDLRAPPGNRLEALSGERKGQHSMRINGDAYQVEIVDYHP